MADLSVEMVCSSDMAGDEARQSGVFATEMLVVVMFQQVGQGDASVL